MRPVSTEMTSILASGQFYVARLYTIKPVGGLFINEIRLTDFDMPLADGYFANKVAIECGDIQVKSGMEVSRVEIVLHVKELQSQYEGFRVMSIDTVIERPGHPQGPLHINKDYYNTPIEYFNNGFFDGADLTIEIVVMPTAGDTTAGKILVFDGKITDVEQDGAAIRLSADSNIVLLDANVPKFVYQPTCVHSIYDAGCKASKENSSFICLVSSPMDGNKLPVHFPDLPISNDALANAMLNIATDNLNGVNLSARIMRFEQTEFDENSPNSRVGILHLFTTLPISPDISTVFFAVPICNGLRSVCKNLFNNEANFLAHEYIPLPEVAL